MTESEDISFKQEQSSALPMKHPGNQLKFILHTMNENAADYVRLFPDKVASHNSEDDWEEVSEGGLAEPKIEEDEHAGLKTDQHEPIKNTFLAGNEVRLDWDSSKSEVKSTILEVLTGTRSLHNKDVVNVSSHQETERIENTFPGDCELRSWNTLKSKRKYTSNSAEMLAEIKRSLAAKVSRQQETDDVMETNDSEDVLDRDKEVFKKIHNDKTTHSRGRMLFNIYCSLIQYA